MPPRRTLQLSTAGLVGSALVLLLAALFIRLGVWQLQRHEQRAVLNEAVASRLEEPPVQLRQAPADSAGLTYRRARLRGTFDHQHSVVLAGRSHKGAPGVRLLTPLRLEGGGAILVDRGWLPSADARTADLSPFDVQGIRELEAVLRPFEAEDRHPPEQGFQKVWYRLGPGARENFPYPLAPVWAAAVERVDAQADYPIPGGLPELPAGPHMGYAIQWFAFAAIGVVGWLILMLRQGERPGAAPRIRET